MRNRRVRLIERLDRGCYDPGVHFAGPSKSLIARVHGRVGRHWLFLASAT
jgi:hypothetical protein